MKLACNIDRHGRIARIITGAVMDLCGAVLIVIAVANRSSALLAAGILASVTGSFMIFEGVRGWCVLRALGFKTRL